MNRPEGTRRLRGSRIAVAAALSAALLIPLGVFGGTSFAQSSAAAGQYKITICHNTHSKKHPTVTIRISNKAWPAHQRHGDKLGACPARSKPAKHQSKHQSKNGKHQSKNGKHGHEATHKQTPSGDHAKSDDHANDHASDHAKGHGK